MLHGVLQRLIATLKREPDYRLSPVYSSRDLLGIAWRRGWQCVRGTVARVVRVWGTRFPVFFGRHIEITGASHFSAGPCLIAEDGVAFRAMAEGGIALGRNVTVARYATLQATGVIRSPGIGIRLGDGVAVGALSYIGGQGGVDIGDATIMGPGVRIFSEEHEYSALDRPIRDQGERRQPVLIGPGCWIGAGATILAGTRIGAGCVVGAGAVVKGSFEENSLIVGIPARRLRSRLSNTAARGAEQDGAAMSAFSSVGGEER